MKRLHIYLLSAGIFLIYGLLAQKLIFAGLGLTFLIMAWAEKIKSDKTDL